MERKIGEIFTYNGRLYQVVKSYSCEGCVFDGKFECLTMACCADENNPVKYIEVKE